MLATLEKVPLLSPTHASIAEGVRDPYDRAAVVAQYREKPDAAPSFIRTTAPGRYAGKAYANEAGNLLSVSLLPRGSSAPARHTTSWKPCRSSPARFPRSRSAAWTSTSHRESVETRMHPAVRVHTLDSYAEQGPSLLFARNFFGARFVELAGGDDIFAGSGFDVRKLPNGAIRLDLLPQPWEQAPAALKQAQVRALAWLERLGLRAPPDDERGHPTGKAPRWAPPPG